MAKERARVVTSEVSWPPFITDVGEGDSARRPPPKDTLEDELALEAAQQALLRVMVRSAHKGEVLITRARVFIVAVSLVFWFSATHHRLLKSDLWVYALCGVGLVVSIFSLLWLARRRVTRGFLIASVVYDAAIAGALAWGLFVFDERVNHGMPKTVGTWVALLTLFSTGFRLSRRIAITGVVAHVAWIVPLAIADLMRPDAQEYLVRDWGVFSTLAMGSGVLGVLVAERTRRLSVDTATSALSAERARTLLGAYVSEEVAAHALTQSSLKLGGERVKAAVVFSDLRGFTAYAENLEPEDLVAQLNAYFMDIVEAIRAEGGVVDKFVGDGVVAVFGVPHPALSDARHALRAAISMQGALVRHNQERAARGLPPLAQGIGVHYGPVVAGNIGTRERANYTVIGDTVNVASRLESSTKDLGVSIVVSEDAALAAGYGVDENCPPLVEIGVMTVKGRREPLRVFTHKL